MDSSPATQVQPSVFVWLGRDLVGVKLLRTARKREKARKLYGSIDEPGNDA